MKKLHDIYADEIGIDYANSIDRCVVENGLNVIENVGKVFNIGGVPVLITEKSIGVTLKDLPINSNPDV